MDSRFDVLYEQILLDERPVHGLNLEVENKIIQDIYDEKDFEKKKVLVLDYINNHILATKRRPLYLLAVSRATSPDQLDSLVTNLTLAGRGLRRSN